MAGLQWLALFFNLFLDAATARSMTECGATSRSMTGSEFFAP
jgi:hypothetical protein